MTEVISREDAEKQLKANANSTMDNNYEAQCLETIIALYDDNQRLVKALDDARQAAEYVIRICEADLRNGVNPSPFIKSEPSAVMAHCYGAMSFVANAYEALAKHKEVFGE